MNWPSLLITLVKIVCVIVPVLTMVAYAVLAERKISAWIQDRVGPNRTAPPLALKIPVLGRLLQSWGLFQPTQGGLKFFLKEASPPLPLRHRVGVCVWRRAGRLRQQLEISLPGRHSIQRADDLLRNRDGHECRS